MRLIFATAVLLLGCIAADQAMDGHKNAALLWFSAGVMVTIVDELYCRYHNRKNYPLEF